MELQPDSENANSKQIIATFLIEDYLKNGLVPENERRRLELIARVFADSKVVICPSGSDEISDILIIDEKQTF